MRRGWRKIRSTYAERTADCRLEPFRALHKNSLVKFPLHIAADYGDVREVTRLQETVVVTVRYAWVDNRGPGREEGGVNCLLPSDAMLTSILGVKIVDRYILIRDTGNVRMIPKQT